MPVAALLGASAGAIALDDIQLTLRRVALRAIGQLTRQSQTFERALADDQIARFAGRVAGAGRSETLLDNRLRLARVLFEKRAERIADDALNRRRHFGIHQLYFGLALK